MYMYIYSIISKTNKSVMTFLYVSKISVCLSVYNVLSSDALNFFFWGGGVIILAQYLKQEAQGPCRLATALQKISYKCVRECISIL